MLRRTTFLLAALVLALSAAARAQTYVELVLDASGSMYNRLADGRYRIEAAKQVLADFVGALPEAEGLNVGLRVYGSRLPALDPAACQDSELLVPLSGVDRASLLSAIRETQALGGTPIAYSLEQARADLAPLDGRRLVVLVTDGEESCARDLAAAAGSLTAGGGIGLHIIGFDLSEQAAASFSGLGSFVNARSAGELAAALGAAVANVVEADTASYPVTVTLTRGGAPADAGTAVLLEAAVDGGVHALASEGGGRHGGAVPAGAYSAIVRYDLTGEATFSDLVVTRDGDNAFAFELDPEASVSLTVVPTDPVAGAEVEVTVSGLQKGARGWVTVVPSQAPDSLNLAYADVPGEGAAVTLRTPDEAQALEARFHLTLPGGGSRVAGRSLAFESRPAEVTLDAPAEGVAGAELSLSWTGPDNEGDYLTVVPAGAPEGSYLDYGNARDGSPALLQLPLEPGEYELRYVSGQSGLTLASRALQVVGAEYAIEAPAEATAGGRVMVAWRGPDNPGDYLTIVPAGAAEGSYLDYAYTHEGNPLELIVPVEAGQYEIRYSSEQASPNPTLASLPLTVSPARITIEAPAAVEAGSEFSVTWTGPDGPQDYLTLVPADAADGEYGDYAYTAEGGTLTFVAPADPGSYEVRYQSDRVPGVFARRSITVR